jgi:hypothetical protein
VGSEAVVQVFPQHRVFAMIQVDDYHHSRVEVLISGQVQARELIARCFSETECGERKLDVLLYSEINAGGYRLVGEINLEQVAIDRFTTVSVSRYIMRSRLAEAREA